MTIDPINSPLAPLFKNRGEEEGVAQLQMVRNCVLVALPEQTEGSTRRQESGLEVAVRNEVRFAPTHGVVVSISPEVKACNVGDTVLFGKEHWENARDAAWGIQDERFKGLYDEQRVFAIKSEGDEGRGTRGNAAPQYYMIIPEDLLFVRVPEGGGLECMNGYVLATGVGKRPPGPLKGEQEGLAIADLGIEQYKLNMAAIVLSGKESWLKAGDYVYTLRHCDIYIEEELNAPLAAVQALKRGDMPLFIIEGENIIAKMNTDTYTAGPKRLIIQPEEVSQESDSGLVNTELGKEKLQIARVIDSATYKAGDKVVYARNSGMALPEIGGVKGLLVINEGDVFAVVKTVSGARQEASSDEWEEIYNESRGGNNITFHNEFVKETGLSIVAFKEKATYSGGMNPEWRWDKYILVCTHQDYDILYRKKAIQEVRV